MKTRVSSSLITGASLAAACLTACGDPLVTAADHGDALFGLHGQAISSQQAPKTDYDVGVLFLRVFIDFDSGTYPTPHYLETEFIPGTISGQFPAEFQVALTKPPAVYPYDIDVFYGTVGGETTDGVFASSNAPDGVRIGHLVIGPAEELASLPDRIAFHRDIRTMGAVLAPYLVDTTITSYQVIYAEGVGNGDVIYPKIVANGVEGGRQISNGFTLVDARTYLEATTWQECAYPFVLAARDTPEFEACVAANAGLIDCISACGPQGEPCWDACHAAFPGQLERHECLELVAQPQIAATCGPAKVPTREQLRILRPQEALSVELGVDDVRAGLWMLHVSGS